jgi:hypothetical protein
MERVDGEINGIKYSIDLSVIERLKENHNIDAVKEIEEALRKAKNEDKSIKG